MKCIAITTQHGTTIERVPNAVAAKRTKEGWTYVSKTVWKRLKRDKAKFSFRRI